jgi:hypothetical protein
MNRLALTIGLVIFSSASYLAVAQEQPPPPPGERAAQDQPPPPPVDPADRDRANRDRGDRNRADGDRADRAAPSPSDKFGAGPTQAPIQAPLPPKGAAYQAPQQAPKGAHYQAPQQAPPPKAAAYQAPQQAPQQAPTQKGGPVQKGGYTAGADAGYRSYSYVPGFSDFDSSGWYDGGGYYSSATRMGNRPAWRSASVKATGRY